MKNIIYLICFAALTLVISSCKTEGENTKPKTVVSQKPVVTLTAMPEAEKKELLAQVDYIDYIWYELPFALSQKEEAAVRTNISYISLEAFPHGQKKCSKSIGRKMYHSNGEIIMEAEIYMSPECQYYLFMDGNTALYANVIRPSGVGFYNNIIQQVMSGMQQQ